MPGSQSLSRPQVFVFDPADASLTGFASNVTGASWTLTADESGDGLAHQVSIRNDSANNKSAINITLVGTDQNGVAQTETIAGPGGSATVESALYYLTLTSVTPAATWGADTADIGWVDEFISPTIPLNPLAEDTALLAATVTGTISYTLQQTFDDLAGDTIVWQAVTNASSVTSTGTYNPIGGATAVRLVANSYSSGAEIRLNVNQTYISNAHDADTIEVSGIVTVDQGDPGARPWPVIVPGNYETVAASQTAQVLGATGAIGDYLQGLLVVPATTSPGNVLILDNATSITVFTGGASSVGTLVPFFIPLGAYSVSGAWKVTTGADVSVVAVGRFT